MMNGAVYEAAVKYLEGGEIPDDDASPRWMFLAACLRETYQIGKKANDRCDELEDTDDDLKLLVELNKDRIQTRMGVLGGIIFISQAIVAILAFTKGLL